MSNLIQYVEAFFAPAAAWGANLPQYISVPLIMILATVGTAVVVKILLLIIRLLFGQKAIDFIKNFPQHLNNASNGLNDSKNK